MPRKSRKTAEQPTDQQLGETLEQAHAAAVDQAVKTNLPPDARIEEPSALMSALPAKPFSAERTGRDTEADEDELKKQYQTVEPRPEPEERKPFGPNPSGTRRGPGHGWSERFVQPVQFRRFEDKDWKGKKAHFITLTLPAGETKLDPEIVEIMHAHQYYKDGKPNGLAEDAKTDQQSYASGLRFDARSRHGKAWVAPDTELGRVAIYDVDQALQSLAQRKEAEIAR